MARISTINFKKMKYFQIQSFIQSLIFIYFYTRETLFKNLYVLYIFLIVSSQILSLYKHRSTKKNGKELLRKHTFPGSSNKTLVNAEALPRKWYPIVIKFAKSMKNITFARRTRKLVDST